MNLMINTINHFLLLLGHFRWENRSKSNWHRLLALAAVGHLAANLLLTAFLTAVSHANYPGGQALSLLHQLEGDAATTTTNNVTVHIDGLAAQTGVSRFGQLHDHWRYDKTEHLRPGSAELMTFTHLIVEGKNKGSFNVRPYAKSHDIVAVVEAFSHVRSTYTHFPPIRIKSKPCLFILKNRNPPLEADFSFTLDKKSHGKPPAHDGEAEGEEERLAAAPDYDFEFTNHFEGDSQLKVESEIKTEIADD